VLHGTTAQPDGVSLEYAHFRPPHTTGAIPAPAHPSPFGVVTAAAAAAVAPALSMPRTNWRTALSTKRSSRTYLRVWDFALADQRPLRVASGAEHEDDVHGGRRRRLPTDRAECLAS
jgi:hypothetical protein